jgi:hypothetical protein
VSGHVFISYSHQSDTGYVQRLATHLTAAGIDVWFDKEIIHGDRWTRVIREKIDTCSAFVVVMTPDAEKSEWVEIEIAQARQMDRPILPLLLKGQRFFTLATVQYADVTGGAMPTAAFVGLLRRLTDGQAPTVNPPKQTDPPVTPTAPKSSFARAQRKVERNSQRGSVLQRFEKRLEGLVEGAFTKVFKGVVHPVEILNAMQREAEAHRAILVGGRTLVPNRYVIDLSPYDHSRLRPYVAALAQELAQSQAEFIGNQAWTVYGDVIVEIERGDGLDTGMFRVTAEVYPMDHGYAGNYDPYESPLPGTGMRNVRLASGDGRTHPLAIGSLVIGRGEQANLRLSDVGVNRRHARLDFDGAQIVLTDLGSTNGTMVNGRRISAVALNPAT